MIPQILESPDMIINPYRFAAAIITSPAHYYALEGSSGATATDTGTGTARTLNNNGTVGSAAGKKNNSRTFGGSADWLSSTSTDFKPTGAFSFSCWVYHNSVSGISTAYGDGIAGFLASEAAGQWQLSVLSGGGVRFIHWATSGTTAKQTTAGSLVASTTWTNIAVTSDGAGVLTIAVNGTDYALSAASPAAGTGWGSTDFALGQHYASATYRWDGRLDETAFFPGYVLTGDEITSIQTNYWNGTSWV